MNLRTIIAIAGKPGLFKVVAQGNQSVIVESLLDKKRMAAHASNKISALEDISIYTDDEDQLLSEVYQKIYEKENGGPCISHKASDAELKDYLNEILPNYDRDRVYMSDIKKLFNWYNMLHKAEMLIPLSQEEEKTEEAPKEVALKEKKVSTKPAVKISPAKPVANASALSKAPAKKPTVQRKSS